MLCQRCFNLYSSHAVAIARVRTLRLLCIDSNDTLSDVFHYHTSLCTIPNGWLEITNCLNITLINNVRFQLWNNVRFQRWNNVIFQRCFNVIFQRVFSTSYFNVETTSYFNTWFVLTKSNAFSTWKFDVVTMLFQLVFACWELANTGKSLLLRTPGSVSWGFICSNVETRLSWTWVSFGVSY